MAGAEKHEIESKLQNAGYRFGFETIQSLNPLISPSNSAKKWTDLAQALKKAKKIRTPRQPVSDSKIDIIEQAGLLFCVW